VGSAATDQHGTKGTVPKLLRRRNQQCIYWSPQVFGIQTAGKYTFSIKSRYFSDLRSCRPNKQASANADKSCGVPLADDSINYRRHHCYMIDGCSITPVPCARDLGVYIDCDLSMRTRTTHGVTVLRLATSTTSNPSCCTVDHS